METGKAWYQGKKLGHVHFAIEYLRNPSVYHLGRKVLIIGAGNVAIIIAISQGPRTIIVSSSIRINIDQKGLAIIDEPGRTARPEVFASGDVVIGARTAIEAARFPKLIANAIDINIQEKNMDYTPCF